MLTKSLHTVTAATNVARHLFENEPRHWLGTTPRDQHASALARRALLLLGYDVNTSPAGCAADVTVGRIVKACAEVVGAQS